MDNKTKDQDSGTILENKGIRIGLLSLLLILFLVYCRYSRRKKYRITPDNSE